MAFNICLHCNAVLNESPQTLVEDQKPCPQCGSMTRLYKNVNIQDAVQVKTLLNRKARNERNRRPFLQQKSGDSLYIKTQKWVHREMLIDRVNNLYSELVLDPETQEVIHHCEELLSEHQNHGSAKKKNA